MWRRIGAGLLWGAVLFLSWEGVSAQELWVYRYNGTASGNDWANSVILGSDGNIYAAGVSEGSGSDRDFAVVSVSDSGAERWVYSYNGPGNWLDEAYSITMGSDGNLYAAGNSWGAGTLPDFTVASVDPSGVERWIYRYDDADSTGDEARSVVDGSDGNIYVTGNIYGTGTVSDLAVVSLTYSGVERWVYLYDGPAHGWEDANSIIMGSDGNLYVAGYSSQIGTGSDFTVVSLTDSGTERWVYTYDGPGSGSDNACSVVMGPDGNLYAAGHSTGVGTNADFTVVSLDTSGVERWVYRYNSSGDGVDEALSLVVGLDGNVFAAGQSGLFERFTVVSLTDSGVERWFYSDIGDRGMSVALDPDGRVYAAGYEAGDFVVVSLTDSGTERWVYTYDGPGSSGDVANSITAGTSGTVYAAGYSCGSVTSDDVTIVSLMRSLGTDAVVIGIGSPPDTVLVDSTYGVRASVGNFGSLPATFDVVASIDGYVDTVQVVNLTPGSSAQVDFQSWQVPSLDSTVYDMTVCVHAPGDVDTTNDCVQKTIFAYDPTGVQEGYDSPVARDFRLWENTPDPFHQLTTISYSLPHASEVTLSIYDITGRLVETLVSETQQPGIRHVRWSRKGNPSGVYFYRLKTGEFVETRKMVLLD